MAKLDSANIDGYNGPSFRKLPRRAKKAFVLKYSAREYHDVCRNHFSYFLDQLIHLTKRATENGEPLHLVARRYYSRSDTITSNAWLEIAKGIAPLHRMRQERMFHTSLWPGKPQHMIYDPLRLMLLKRRNLKLNGDLLSALEVQEDILSKIEKEIDRAGPNELSSIAILVDKEVVPVRDFDLFRIWFDLAQRQLWHVLLPGDIEVSTVFLGYMVSEGHCFETLVTGGLHGGTTTLYRTYAEAEAGHRAMVALQFEA